MSKCIRTSSLWLAGPLLTAACLLCGLALAQQPELTSSLEFIRAFVEQNAYYETSGPNGEFTSLRDQIDFAGCQATVHVQAIGADEPPYKRETVRYDVLFDLRKMAPKVSATPRDLNGNTLPHGREWVLLKTADGSETILLQRGATPVSTISVLPLQGGANHQETQKLADAFSRAITLCGQAK